MVAAAILNFGFCLMSVANEYSHQIWFVDRYLPCEAHSVTESHFGKIQDGGGRHLGFGFLAIFQSPIKVFASNFLYRLILAIHGLCWPQIRVGKIQDGGGCNLGFGHILVAGVGICIKFGTHFPHTGYGCSKFLFLQKFKMAAVAILNLGFSPYLCRQFASSLVNR